MSCASLISFLFQLNAFCTELHSHGASKLIGMRALLVLREASLGTMLTLIDHESRRSFASQ